MIRAASRRIALCLAVLVATLAWAEDPDAGALRLADETPSVVEKASDWRIFTEGAVGAAMRRSDGAGRDNRRLSLDLQYDAAVAPDWRAVVADRLDLDWPAQRGDENGINTLKEAYLSWRLQPETLADAGRVNVRNGVATGYNPTDYFRTGALRSVVSISPASLKENRQGSVMLRVQRLWESGSVTALYSPELKRRPDPEGLSLDMGATNPQNRRLIAVSQKIGTTLTPQFLVFKEEALPTQYGLNLTALVGDATVAHVEWSGGRSPSLLAQALEQAAPTPWRNRLATGLAHTTPTKISLTAEYHYNGVALDKSEWNVLRQGPLPVYGRYRNWVQTVQDLPTWQALFFYGVWRDALVNRLDLSAMVNFDLADSSRRLWLEARYRTERFEYALQWQGNRGQPLSNFGALPESWGWQSILRYYY